MRFSPPQTRFAGSSKNSRTATFDVIVLEITLEVFSLERCLVVRGGISDAVHSLIDSI